jgi:hypothetical protein
MRKIKDPPRVTGIIHAGFDGSKLASEATCGGCADGENLAVTREKFLGV